MQPDHSRFDPQSHDSMFARILVEIEQDRKTREDFRQEVRERFEKGAARMDEIHGEVKKTNGRVTRLEDSDRIRMAKIAGAAAIASTLATALIWLLEHGYLRVT
jgi:cytochrome P450